MCFVRLVVSFVRSVGIKYPPSFEHVQLVVSHLSFFYSSSIPQLYCESYDTIPWTKTRHLVAEMDNYSPIPRFMQLAQNCLVKYEQWAIFQPFKRYVRKLGLKFCAEYMAAEDLQTNFINIGPVNKSLNLLSAFHGTCIYYS